MAMRSLRSAPTTIWGLISDFLDILFDSLYYYDEDDFEMDERSCESDNVIDFETAKSYECEYAGFSWISKIKRNIKLFIKFMFG